MSTEFINNDLCASNISSLPVVNLQAVLREDELTDLTNEENLDDNLKHTHNVNIIQLHTLINNDVTLQSNLNDFPEEKRLQNEYIALPLGEVKYSVSYVCRLCASVTDINSAVNIFPSDAFQENLSSKINKYLPIIVYESDPFPKTICKYCATKLNQFHELVEKCILVEEQLRQTYVFDERYVEEFNKKTNPKSQLEMLKQESVEQNAGNLYAISDFHFVENININNLNSNEIKSDSVKEKITLNFNNKDSKLANFSEKKIKKTSSSIGDESLYENNEVIQCMICGSEIKDLTSCIEHSKTHLESKSEFICSLCKNIFEIKEELESHCKTHFEKNIENKEVRLVNSRDKSKAHQQKLLKHKLKIFNKIICCKKCKESVENVDTAMEHCVKHRPTNIKSYPCVLCVRRVGKTKLRDHLSLHFPMVTKPILSCDNCNNLYPDEKTLKYHRCSKLRKYKCSQCKLGFKSEDRLKFHEDFHKNKSTFCDICKKDFKFESRMYLHFAGVHNGIRDKPYCCDVCGKTFTWLTVLNSHKRTHTNERPYKCGKCDARFCNKYSLTGHMPSHEDHPQFFCDKCDYHTGRKQNLQKHVNRFHKEINSSQMCIRCQVCNEIFPNQHHLKVEQHMFKHSQNEIEKALLTSSENKAHNNSFQELLITKLFQCERCERCYMSSEHLTQHRSKHIADNSSLFYECRLCDMGFSKHDLLVKHQKVHVNISSQYTSKLSVLTVISCDICGIECVDYRQLLNHKDRGNCMQKKMSGTVRPKKVLIKKHLKPLKTHQLFINSNGLFECPSCQRTYKNRRRYRLHLATHTNIYL